LFEEKLMRIKTVDSNQARNNWREMLDMVLGKEIDVVITRYNKPVVTMLDYEDYLSIREELVKKRAQRQEEAFQTMLASERILAREWDTADEDEAWQNL